MARCRGPPSQLLGEQRGRASEVTDGPHAFSARLHAFRHRAIAARCAPLDGHGLVRFGVAPLCQQQHGRQPVMQANVFHVRTQWPTADAARRSRDRPTCSRRQPASRAPPHLLRPTPPTARRAIVPLRPVPSPPAGARARASARRWAGKTQRTREGPVPPRPSVPLARRCRRDRWPRILSSATVFRRHATHRSLRGGGPDSATAPPARATHARRGDGREGARECA